MMKKKIVILVISLAVLAIFLDKANGELQSLVYECGAWGSGICDSLLLPNAEDREGNKFLYFRSAEKGQKLPLGSVLRMGKRSKLILRFELAKKNEDVLMSEYYKVIRQLFEEGEHRVANDKHYVIVMSNDSGVAVNLAGYDFRGKLDIYCEDHSGEVLILPTISESFDSAIMHSHFDTILGKYASDEAFRSKIGFAAPRINEKLPLNTLILTGKGSELTMGFEPLREDDSLIPSVVLKKLEKALGAYGRPEALNGKYYLSIRDRGAYILRDSEDFLSEFDIFIAGYSGSVYISTDSEAISQLGPATCTKISSRSTRSKDGFIDADIEKAKLGIVLGSEATPHDGYMSIQIHGVFKNSKAHKAGLMPEDSIIKVEGRTFSDLEEFYQLLNAAKKTDRVTLTVHRDSRLLDYTVFMDD